jgi:hypothetical protein
MRVDEEIRMRVLSELGQLDVSLLEFLIPLGQKVWIHGSVLAHLTGRRR